MKNLFIFLFLLTGYLSTGQDELRLSINYNQQGNIPEQVNEAYSLSDKGYYDSAINILNSLLPLYSKKDYVIRSKIYHYLGLSYSLKGEIANGIRAMLLAASLLEEHPDEHSSELSAIFNRIALALNRTRDNKEAFTYLQKAENLALAGKDIETLTSIHINRGRIYKEMRQWDKSLAEFKRSLFLFDSLKNHDTHANLPRIKSCEQVTYINLGQLALSREQFHEALRYGTIAMHLNSNIVDPYQYIPNLLLLGNAYMGLKDYRLSEKYFTQAQSASIQYNLLEGICESAYGLSWLYDYTGKYQLALKSYRIYKQFDDSIRRLDKMNSVKNMEIKYSVAQKDKEIMSTRLKTLEQDRTIKNRNFSILIITTVSVLLIVVFFFLYKNYQQKARFRQQELQASIQDKKIAVMKAMIEGEEKERSRMAEILHDGIGSIISAAKMNFSTAHSTDIPNKNIYANGLSLLDEAATEIRNTAHNLMPEKLLLEGLQLAIAGYCERVSNKEALAIEYEFNGTFEALDNATALLVYRIVQELINNILKHAAATKVFVQVNYTTGLLNLAVEDNGKGMNNENISNREGGMGLKTIREKISVLNGEMTIQSGFEKGTQVYIDLDC